MLPYSFYVSDEELLVSVGSYMETNRVSVEKVLKIVYQEQAVFRIRPVNRCSQTIAGIGSGDNTVRLWDLNTETPMFTCRGHKNHVLSIAWSPDAKCLVSGDKDGKVCCWDPIKGELQGKPLSGHRKAITGIAWEPAHLSCPSRRFVTCSLDGSAKIWDFKLRKSLISLSGHTKAVTSVKWVEMELYTQGTFLIISEDRTIIMWETKGKFKHVLKEHGHWVNSLSLSTDYVLRTGAFDHTRKEISSDEEMKKIALERYNKAKGTKDSPERLVSGSDDRTMNLWEPSVSLKRKNRSTGHQQLVNHVSFSPNGQWIASGSFDGSVRLWNGFTGDYVTKFRGHVGRVHQITWSADSRMLLSGSKDSTLKIWDIRTKRLKQNLSGHSDPVYAVDWSPDGEKVASGGKDKVLKLWKG
ncbi:unnamed protein product [Arabis nemorensis]|uniref:Uncharacterized protein n=1 Tax=Arabis nemorensis TaxID=586526 RepID=A0A565CIG0_9BRAS|nr:unnamed protein product [Arabis nemorensis]